MPHVYTRKVVLICSLFPSSPPLLPPPPPTSLPTLSAAFSPAKSTAMPKKRRRSQELEQAYQKARQQAQENRLEYHKKALLRKRKGGRAKLINLPSPPSSIMKRSLLTSLPYMKYFSLEVMVMFIWWLLNHYKSLI